MLNNPMISPMSQISDQNGRNGFGSFDTYGERNMTQNEDMMFGMRP